MWTKLFYHIINYWESIADPRTQDIYLVRGGIWRLLLVILVYLTVTARVIPIYMQNKRAYKLKTLLLVYNLAMIVTNAHLCQLFFSAKLPLFFNFQYPNPNDRWFEDMNYIPIVRMFTISRLIELMDTVFFGLRKKNKQITFLHLYHHSVVLLICWVTLKTNPLTPISRMFAIINTLIHVFMYSYYALSSCGPKFQKYLWWKKYLTFTQIIQFVIIGLYGTILYFLQEDFPIVYFILVIGQCPIFFVLFYLFYLHSYKKTIIF